MRGGGLRGGRVRDVEGGGGKDVRGVGGEGFGVEVVLAGEEEGGGLEGGLVVGVVGCHGFGGMGYGQ